MSICNIVKFEEEEEELNDEGDEDEEDKGSSPVTPPPSRSTSADRNSEEEDRKDTVKVECISSDDSGDDDEGAGGDIENDADGGSNSESHNQNFSGLPVTMSMLHRLKSDLLKIIKAEVNTQMDKKMSQVKGQIKATAGVGSALKTVVDQLKLNLKKLEGRIQKLEENIKSIEIGRLEGQGRSQRRNDRKLDKMTKVFCSKMVEGIEEKVGKLNEKMDKLDKEVQFEMEEDKKKIMEKVDSIRKLLTMFMLRTVACEKKLNIQYPKATVTKDQGQNQRSGQRPSTSSLASLSVYHPEGVSATTASAVPSTSKNSGDSSQGQGKTRKGTETGEEINKEVKRPRPPPNSTENQKADTDDVDDDDDVQFIAIIPQKKQSQEVLINLTEEGEDKDDDIEILDEGPNQIREFISKMPKGLVACFKESRPVNCSCQRPFTNVVEFARHVLDEGCENVRKIMQQIAEDEGKKKEESAEGKEEEKEEEENMEMDGVEVEEIEVEEPRKQLPDDWSSSSPPDGGYKSPGVTPGRENQSPGEAPPDEDENMEVEKEKTPVSVLVPEFTSSSQSQAEAEDREKDDKKKDQEEDEDERNNLETDDDDKSCKNGTEGISRLLPKKQETDTASKKEKCRRRLHFPSDRKMRRVEMEMRAARKLKKKYLKNGGAGGLETRSESFEGGVGLKAKRRKMLKLKRKVKKIKKEQEDQPQPTSSAGWRKEPSNSKCALF